MSDNSDYFDANLPSILHVGTHQVRCQTTGEALIKRDKLPPDQQKIATIELIGGRTYKADEIDRRYHRPKPPGAGTSSSRAGRLRRSFWRVLLRWN